MAFSTSCVPSSPGEAQGTKTGGSCFLVTRCSETCYIPRRLVINVVCLSGDGERVVPAAGHAGCEPSHRSSHSPQKRLWSHLVL